MNRRYLYLLFILLLGVLMLSAAVCTTKTAEPAVPAIVSFTASPTEVNPGQWTTLEWTTSGSTSATIQPGIGSVGPSGSLKLSPDQTTTYALTATNEAGSATASITVTVISVDAGKPDLVITDIYGYDGASLYYKIKNQGNADAGPSKSHLYVLGETGDYIKKPRAIDYVDSLAPGEEIATTFPNLDLAYDGAGYKIRYGASGEFGFFDVLFKICADVDSAVDESNEDNNCLEDNGL